MVHFMLYEFYHNKQKRDCVLPSSQRYTKLCHNHSIEDWKGLSLLKSGRHYPNVTVTGRRQSCVPRDSRSSWPHLPEGTRVVWVPRRRQNPVQKSLQSCSVQRLREHSGTLRQDKPHGQPTDRPFRDRGTATRRRKRPEVLALPPTE